MTREEILEVLNGKNKEVRQKLLKEYCLETAINYFKHKHSINEVRKPHNEGYEVILYY